MSTTTPLTSLHARIQSFFAEFGEEIDDCNPNAWETLQDIALADDPSRESIEYFIWDYADELDACHPDAFDILLDIATQHNIEL